MSDTFIPPLIFLILYLMLLVVALGLLFFEFRIHKSLFNNIKTLFYCLLFSNCITRSIFLVLGIIGSFQAGSFAANFPSYLFITLTSFLGIQILQFTPKDANIELKSAREDEESKLLASTVTTTSNDNGVKKYTLFVIITNIFMYVSSFMVYSVSSFREKKEKNKDGSNSNSSNSSSGNEDYSEENDPFDQALEYYFIFFLCVLIVSHLIIAYKRRTLQSFFSRKLHRIDILQILLIICILFRMIILATNPSYSNSDIDFWEGSAKTVTTTIFYFLIGEIIPCLLMIFIQFYLPYHDSSYNLESMTSATSHNLSQSFDIGSPIGGIYSASGANIHECQTNFGGSPKNCVVKVINKRDNPDNYMNIRNEAKIYQRIREHKPNEILEFERVVEVENVLYLFLEKMNTNLFSYVNLRKLVGEGYYLKRYENSQLLLNQSNSAGQNPKTLPGEPYPFNPKELKNCLLQIANGLLFLHNHNIIHRDLRPHNIFINLDGNNRIKVCKIGDFDNSYMERNSKKPIKPLLVDDNLDKNLQYANDVLQFGYLIHFLITFDYEEKRFSTDRYSPPDFKEADCSPEHRSFFELYKKCTYKQYDQRLKPDSIVKYLESL